MNNKTKSLLATTGIALLLPAAAMAQNNMGRPSTQNQPAQMQPGQAPVPASHAPTARKIIPAAHPRLDSLLKSIVAARANIQAQESAKKIDGATANKIDAQLAGIKANVREEAAEEAKGQDLGPKEYEHLRDELQSLYSKYKVAASL